MSQFHVPLVRRPRLVGNSEMAFVVNKSLVESNDEMALALSFMCDRQLFGYCYWALLPEYFEVMGANSGVFIAPLVSSAEVLPGMKFPGDIDLLVIPYEANELVLSMSLAIELKVVRAKFAKQGKSPNEYGFSQGKSLLAHGFPFVAVGHLIVSDTSPETHWRQVHKMVVLNGETGRVSAPEEVSADMLPADLIRRCHGRMLANCNEQNLGLFAAYLSGNGTWMPDGRRATASSTADRATLEAIGAYYERNFKKFLDTPRR